MSSKLYTVIKKYFTSGIYSKDDVKLFLNSGKITEEEYNEIISSEESN